MSGARIRAARSSDAPALASLLGELGYPSASAALPARLRSIAEHGGAVLVAVDEGDAPIGLTSVTTQVGIHSDAPIGYITALVASPAARGIGVGRALVAAAEAWARERGCARLSVTSAEHRSGAHAFYPRCGMPYTGRRFSKSLVDGG